MGDSLSSPRYSIHHSAPTPMNDSSASNPPMMNNPLKMPCASGGISKNDSGESGVGVSVGVGGGGSSGVGDGVGVNVTSNSGGTVGVAVGGASMPCVGAMVGVAVGGSVGIMVAVGVVTCGSARSRLCWAEVGSNSTQ